MGRNQHGYITPTFWGPPSWGEINTSTQTLPSWGSHDGEEATWVYNPYLLGVPMVGRDQYDHTTLAFSGSPYWGEINMARKPIQNVDNGGPKPPLKNARRAKVPLFWEATKEATRPVPSKAHNTAVEANWLRGPYPLNVPTLGRSQSGYITGAFSGSIHGARIKLPT